MVRGTVLITCLLLTILGQSFGEFVTNRSSTKNYEKCYKECVKPCNGFTESVNKAARVYCALDGQVRYCQNYCDDYAKKVHEEPVEDDEEEYLSADLKKRELDELRKIIGIGS